MCFALKRSASLCIQVSYLRILMGWQQIIEEFGFTTLGFQIRRTSLALCRLCRLCYGCLWLQCLSHLFNVLFRLHPGMSLRIPNLQYTLQVYSGIRGISISGSWFVGMLCWHDNYAAIFTEDLKIATSGNSSARTVRGVRCLEQLLVYFRTVAPSQRQVILRTPSANLLQALEINFKKLQESSMKYAMFNFKAYNVSY